MAYSSPNIPLQGGSIGVDGTIYRPNRGPSTITGNTDMAVDRPARGFTGYQKLQDMAKQHMLRNAYHRPSGLFGGNGGNAYQAFDNHFMHMSDSTHPVGSALMTSHQSGMASLNNNAFGNTFGIQSRNDTGHGFNQSTVRQASTMLSPSYFFKDTVGVPRSTGGDFPITFNHLSSNQANAYHGNFLDNNLDMSTNGFYDSNFATRSAVDANHGNLLNNNFDMSIDGFTNGDVATQSAVNGNHGNVEIYGNAPETQWDSTPESFIDPNAHASTPSDIAPSSPATSIAESILLPPPTGRRVRVDPDIFTLPYRREYKGYYLTMGRHAGLTFKQLSDKIRAERLSVTDSCNESTLRGIHRAYIKTKAQRPRRPTWNRRQIAILGQAVEAQAQRLREQGKVLDMTYVGSIKWKVVAVYIVMAGGDFEFGASACKKKFIEKVEEGVLEPLQ